MIGKFYFLYTEQIKEIFIQECRYCLLSVKIKLNIFGFIMIYIILNTL